MSNFNVRDSSHINPIDVKEPRFLAKYRKITALCSEDCDEDCAMKDCPNNRNWVCPEEHREEYDAYIKDLMKYFGYC